MYRPMNVTERAPSSARVPDARSPFVRLTELLGDTAPGMPVINISVGEPQHPVPPFVAPVLAKQTAAFGRYPGNAGTDGFRQAVAGWLGRRYRLARPIDPMSEILVLAGSREGLFLSAIAAKRFIGAKPDKPAILVPNPFYAPYSAGAIAADCEPVYLDATAKTGFLPDLDALSPELLGRAVAFYLASPANPQGSVASRDYLARVAALAQKHNFMLFVDECYSEIFWKDKPTGGLEVAGQDFANVVTFNSLSKRSSLPGLRVGFVAGDKQFLAALLNLRTVSAPQVPVPAQEVAIAAYNDETHVEENRALYRAKFDLADQIIGNRYGYKRPAGGFFLWLDVSQHGGSEGAAVKLWKEAGLRVVPGSYAARPQADGFNAGEGYIRVAMVQDRETTAEALHRLVKVLG
ncbi:MAG: N-succinyldiaminopimelate aminotransferase [Hyphomicrobiales bacterium]|nr:N-succinyldiaminopimelate aminotransferase [Hyphomicrobiales bacterium]